MKFIKSGQMSQDETLFQVVNKETILKGLQNFESPWYYTSDIFCSVSPALIWHNLSRTKHTLACIQGTKF